MRPTTATEIEAHRRWILQRDRIYLRLLMGPYLDALGIELRRLLSSSIRESQASSPSDNPAENG